MFEMCDFRKAMNLNLNDVIRIGACFVQVNRIDDPTRQVRSPGDLTLHYIPNDRILMEEEDDDYIVVNRHLNVAVYRWVV